MRSAGGFCTSLVSWSALSFLLLEVDVSDVIPQWARDKAAHLYSRENGGWWEIFARYIAQHEQPPVDPDLIEAREVAVQYSLWCSGEIRGQFRSGKNDDWAEIKIALAAIKRGRELANQS
jgi:hypothetical protein